MRKLDFKPGDLIEWVNKANGKLVVENEMLWSTIEEHWIPVGSNLVHLCTSVDSKMYSWLNEKGLFHAHVDDIASLTYRYFSSKAIPRTRR